MRDYPFMTLTDALTFFFAFGLLRFIEIIETMNFFIRLVWIIELCLCQLVRGVTYEILDLYRFLVTELVFLDDYLLNYMSLICHRDKI